MFEPSPLRSSGEPSPSVSRSRTTLPSLEGTHTPLSRLSPPYRRHMVVLPARSFAEIGMVFLACAAMDSEKLSFEAIVVVFANLEALFCGQKRPAKTENIPSFLITPHHFKTLVRPDPDSPGMR